MEKERITTKEMIKTIQPYKYVMIFVASVEMYIRVSKTEFIGTMRSERSGCYWDCHDRGTEIFINTSWLED